MRKFIELETAEEFEHMTNEQFLSHCMNFSDYGALCQSAIITALQKGVSVMLKDKEQVLKDAADGKYDRYIVHVPSWIGCLEELENRIELKYGNKKSN